MRKTTVFFIIALLSLILTARELDDARFLEKSISYTLNPDGSWQKEYYHRVRLETYYATNRLLGETFILFNPRFQDLKIIKSETTMKDGKVMNSPANAFNPVLPRDAHGFSDFSHLREMVITHTGLERGATIILHYLLKTKAGFMPYFSGREMVTDQLPIDRYVLKIKVPADSALHLVTYPGQIRPEVLREDDGISHTILYENLNGDPSEPLDRDLNDYRILFSSAENWDGILPAPEPADSGLSPILNQINTFRNSAGVTEDELVLKIQGLVADDIDHCSIGMELSGFQVRPFSRIIESNYATPIEKAYLLRQLLKLSNIPADMVAVPYHPEVLRNVPTIFQFKEFLIKIKNNPENPVFLNPNAKTEHPFPYHLSGSEYFNLSEKKIDRFESLKTPVHVISMKGILQMNDSQATADLDLSLSGLFNPYFLYIKDGQLSLFKMMKSMMPVTKLEIAKIHRLTPQTVRASVKVAGDFFTALYQNRSQMKRFTFPNIPESLIELKARQHPLILGGPFQFNIQLLIKNIDQYHVMYLAPDCFFENDTGYYQQQINTRSSGDLELNIRLSLHKSIIQSDQYPRFRELLTRYFQKQPLLVLKKLEVGKPRRFQP